MRRSSVYTFAGVRDSMAPFPPFGMSPPRLPSATNSSGGAPSQAPAPAHNTAGVSQSQANDPGLTQQQPCRQSSAFGGPGTPPHPHSRLANVYSNAGTMMTSSYASASSGGQSLAAMLAGTSISTPPSAHQQHLQQQPYLPPFPDHTAQSQASQQPRPQYWPPALQGAATQSAQHYPQANASLNSAYSEPCSALPTVKPQRSASERLSPRSAVDFSTSCATPRTAAVAAAPQSARAQGHGTRSGGSTPRSATSGHSGPHLGKNPASGYPGVPLTPAQALTRYAGVNALTEYEQSEVLNYPHVYYIGAGANKHRARPKHRAPSSTCPACTLILCRCV